MIGGLDAAQTLENARAAVAFLAANEATNGNVGAVGFCWGGGMVNQLAASAPDNLGAAVAYYGRQPAAEQVASIEAPIMLHYAGLDERINAGIPDGGRHGRVTSRPTRTSLPRRTAYQAPPVIDGKARARPSTTKAKPSVPMAK